MHTSITPEHATTAIAHTNHSRRNTTHQGHKERGEQGEGKTGVKYQRRSFFLRQASHQKHKEWEERELCEPKDSTRSFKRMRIAGATLDKSFSKTLKEATFASGKSATRSASRPGNSHFSKLAASTKSLKKTAVSIHKSRASEFQFLPHKYDFSVRKRWAPGALGYFFGHASIPRYEAAHECSIGATSFQTPQDLFWQNNRCRIVSSHVFSYDGRVSGYFKQSQAGSRASTIGIVDWQRSSRGFQNIRRLQDFPRWLATSLKA